MDGERDINTLVHEYFGNVINELDKIEDYKRELNEKSGEALGGRVKDVNTIPYGKPSGCHRQLIVIIDGKNDIDIVLNMALKHVGISCRGGTTKVLFYVACNMTDWDLHWELFKPSFDALVAKNVIEYWFYISKRNTAVNVHNSFEIDLVDIEKRLRANAKFEYKKMMPPDYRASELYYSKSQSFRPKNGSDRSLVSFIYHVKFIKSKYVNLCSFSFFYLPELVVTAKEPKVIAIGSIVNMEKFNFNALLKNNQGAVNICFSKCIYDKSELDRLIGMTKKLLVNIKEAHRVYTGGSKRL